jgi:hypothetical protein
VSGTGRSLGLLSPGLGLGESHLGSVRLGDVLMRGDPPFAGHRPVPDAHDARVDEFDGGV